MKVCDRCMKPLHENKGNPINLKNKKYEICDSCTDRIIKFLGTPDSTNPIAKFFGGGN